MFKVNASNLNTVLDSAQVGGGKGFVMAVSPVKRQVTKELEGQFATISSSDGTKTGRASVMIHTDDMEKDEVYYASGDLKQAVALLSKVTEQILIEDKGSYLELTDENKDNRVKVELMEKDIVLQLPSTPDDTLLIVMSKEKFVNALRLGGYAATESTTGDTDSIYFSVEPEQKILYVRSNRKEIICEAKAQIQNVQGDVEKAKTGHKVNYRFIQSMVPKLSGEVIQIAFTPTFMVVLSSTAIFASKKSAGSMVEGLKSLIRDKEYDYTGNITKKKLLLSMDIVLVGATEKPDERIVSFETTETGTLKIASHTEANKSEVSQKAHEGMMNKREFYVEVIKTALNGCGDELHYFGKNENPILHIDGVDGEVEYSTAIAPLGKKQETK